MTREVDTAIISRLDGSAQLMAKLLYRSGLRTMEAVRIRVKDIDAQMKPLTVRSGKGDKDRFTTVPTTLTPLLQNHRAEVKMQHQKDSAQGHGEVYLPHTLTRKFPHTAKAWGWPYVFTARNISVDPCSGVTRRHHVDPSVINKTIAEGSWPARQHGRGCRSGGWTRLQSRSSQTWWNAWGHTCDGKRWDDLLREHLAIARRAEGAVQVNSASSFRTPSSPRPSRTTPNQSAAKHRMSPSHARMRSGRHRLRVGYAVIARVVDPGS